MAKTKHDQAQAKEQEEAARKEVNKKEKALEVAAGVTKGAELMQALELHGSKHLFKFTLADLKAFIT